MPFCPKCGGEYREGFKLCSDCMLELVDAPPEKPRAPGLDSEENETTTKAQGKPRSAIDNTASCVSCRPEAKLVMVFKALNDMEALQVKAMLAGSNITAVAAESGGQQGRMEVPVFVDENDVADARELIRTSYGKAVEDGDDETVIYELEEGEELALGEDGSDEEEDDDEDEDEDDEPLEGHAATVEEKAEELRARMAGTGANKGLLIVLMVVILIIIAIAYLYQG